MSQYLFLGILTTSLSLVSLLSFSSLSSFYSRMLYRSILEQDLLHLFLFLLVQAVRNSQHESDRQHDGAKRVCAAMPLSCLDVVVLTFFNRNVAVYSSYTLRSVKTQKVTTLPVLSHFLVSDPIHPHQPSMRDSLSLSCSDQLEGTDPEVHILLRYLPSCVD